MISELERLRLENEALHRCVQKFANVSADEHPHIASLVAGVRQQLREIAARRKDVRPKDIQQLEDTCFFIVNHCTQMGLKDPLLVLERLDKRQWHAVVDQHVETIGVGDGATALSAMQLLHTRVKSYRQRLARGLTEWSADRSWNTCLRQNCRGPVEAEDGSTKFFDGCEGHCIECGAVYLVSVTEHGGFLHRFRRKKALGS
jgi:hypothetical protein